MSITMCTITKSIKIAKSYEQLQKPSKQLETQCEQLQNHFKMIKTMNNYNNNLNMTKTI